MRAIALLVVGVAACGGTAKPTPLPEPRPEPATAPNRELTPALEPLAWLVGDWHGDWRDQDRAAHCVAAGGTLYWIELADGAVADLGIIDDGDGESEVADGALRWIYIGTDAAGHEAELRDVVSEPDHLATTIRSDGYVAERDLRQGKDGTLVERVSEHDSLMGSHDAIHWLVRASDPVAPALEAADRAFDADTAARGVDGWVAAFAADGIVFRGKPFVGAAAIAEKLTPTLTTGHLRWAPIASRVHGDIGFTVGTAMWTANDATEPSWRGSYVTIWRKQADGSWKVAFDTGRTAQPPK